MIALPAGLGNCFHCQISSAKEPMPIRERVRKRHGSFDLDEVTRSTARNTK